MCRLSVYVIAYNDAQNTRACLEWVADWLLNCTLRLVVCGAAFTCPNDLLSGRVPLAFGFKSWAMAAHY
jgi:hypothetical protein